MENGKIPSGLGLNSSISLTRWRWCSRRGGERKKKFEGPPTRSADWRMASPFRGSSGRLFTAPPLRVTTWPCGGWQELSSSESLAQ